ncbi:MAG: gluconate 2-dehydrogenase subunit 3 family protein [Bacteroidales bacterium]
MNQRSISRRNFIRLSATGAGCMFMAGCYNLPKSSRFILTYEEANILDALADQIIPPDEFAGGRDAGVTNFIDKQLAGFYNEHTEMYRSCLKGLDTTAREVFGKGFTELEFNTQFEYLTDIESGKFNSADWNGNTPSSFFNTLRNHCLQGYYGSPRHGGNKDHVSYRMMKLDYPFLVGRNHHLQ